MSSVIQVSHPKLLCNYIVYLLVTLEHTLQWMTMLFFALLVGIIFYKLDDKEYNPQTVISDRYILFTCTKIVISAI